LSEIILHPPAIPAKHDGDISQKGQKPIKKMRYFLLLMVAVWIPMVFVYWLLTWV